MRHWTLMLVSCLLSLVFAATALEAQGPGEGRRGRPGEPPGRAVSPLQAALDADGDGTISAQEMEGAAAALKKLDRDGDGKLGREELGPQSGRGRQGRGEGGSGAEAGSLASPPVPKDDAEKKILDVLDDVSQNRRGNMNVPVNDGRLLRLLAARALSFIPRTNL